MPKLLVFAACEKVIISQDENNPTLIALLTELRGEYEVNDPTTELPANAMYPRQWAFFALWRTEASDEGRTFEQRVRLTSPSNKTLVDSHVVLRFSGTTHRVVGNLSGIPIGEPGEWVLQLFLSESGQAAPPSEPLAVYPITIHLTKTVPSAPSAVLEQK